MVSDGTIYNLPIAIIYILVIIYLFMQKSSLKHILNTAMVSYSIIRLTNSNYFNISNNLYIFSEKYKKTRFHLTSGDGDGGGWGCGWVDSLCELTSRLLLSYSFIAVIHCSLVITASIMLCSIFVSTPVNGTNFGLIPLVWNVFSVNVHIRSLQWSENYVNLFLNESVWKWFHRYFKQSCFVK